jgi:hypothetical protein
MSPACRPGLGGEEADMRQRRERKMDESLGRFDSTNVLSPDSALK